MTPPTLSWSADDSVIIESGDHLKALLRRLYTEWRSHPGMAELARPDGAVLAIGLGRKGQTVLSLVPAPDPPYFASAGDPGALGTVSFSFYGSDSEFPMRQAVDVERAIAAMLSFLGGEDMPPEVEWEEV